MNKTHFTAIKKSFLLAVTYAVWLIQKWTTPILKRRFRREQLEMFTVPEQVQTCKEIVIGMLEPLEQVDLHIYPSYEYKHVTWHFIGATWNMRVTFNPKTGETKW
jgi:hypothetical protein